MMERRRKPLAGALLGGMVGILLVAFVFLIVRTYTVTDQIRESQVANTYARKSSDQTLKTVKSCTTPGGSCYERGRKQTAGAVGSINRVVILAAACSVGLEQDMKVADRQAAIQSCVVDRLARQAQ